MKLQYRCGAATDFAPFYREMSRGSSPQDAWKKTRNYILNNRIVYGTWKGNKFMSASGGENDPCNVHQIRLEFLKPDFQPMLRPKNLCLDHAVHLETKTQTNLGTSDWRFGFLQFDPFFI